MEAPTTNPTSVPTAPNNGSGSAEVTAALAAVDRVGRRRWPLLLLGIALGAGGTVVVATLLGDGDGSADTSTAVVELATAPVEERDLIEEIEWSGTLGYGESVSLSGNGGTVTDTATLGSLVERGDVLVDINDEPVVVLYGDTPMWRSLADGSEGADVRQLEANLAALGYDPDQTVDIDDTFTPNTAAMVERWQTDVGREVTGTIELGSILIVEGPSVVSTVVDIGSPATGPVATVVPRSAVVDVVSTVDGVVTATVPAGIPVEHGTELYRIGEVPVLAIVETDPVAAALTDPTFTTLELERALADGGYDPDGDMTVDGVATDATVAAVERWQAAAGLANTGQVEPGYYLPLPAGLVVESALVADGDSVLAGGPILSLSGSRLAVAMTVDVADSDEFEVGQDVTVVLADESEVDGVVSAIGPVLQPADPQLSPTVDITVDVAASADGDSATQAGADPVEGPVTVITAGDVVVQATVVPTRGLVALAEGGFAVERIRDGGPAELVGIEIGTFDDGVVEVVDGDLVPGDDVVVPQ